MLRNKTIAVVVPTYNEEKQISLVIESMPDFVDRIVLINDNSNDNTLNVMKSYLSTDRNKSDLSLESNLNRKIEENLYNMADIKVHEENIMEKKYFVDSNLINTKSNNDRIIIINHKINSGVGASIASGYKWCKDHDIDCTAVMAGDGQMDPNELEPICTPVVDEDINYVKGNRLLHKSSWSIIPKTRFFGNSILGILTKIASGYWHVSDTQTGFTAISNSALNKIKLYRIYKSYGMPNDLLVKLNIAMCTIREVVIKPVYNIGENSKMKIYIVIPLVTWLLIKSFFKRLWIKYLFRDFHPLFILYHFSFFLGLFSLKYFYEIAIAIISPDFSVPMDTLLKYMFLSITSFQSFLFAMWMDILENKVLNK